MSATSVVEKGFPTAAEMEAALETVRRVHRDVDEIHLRLLHLGNALEAGEGRLPTFEELTMYEVYADAVASLGEACGEESMTLQSDVYRLDRLRKGEPLEELVAG